MSKGIAYKGDVYMRLFENGVLSPKIIGPIGGTKLSLKNNSEQKQRFGKGRDNFGLQTGALTVPAPTDVTVGFNEVPAEMLAMLFSGTSSALSETGGTVTAESITLVKDVWVKTAQRNISLSAITGLVLGTDFIEHPRLGAIKALTVGAVGVQSLNYTYSGITGTRILGGMKSLIEVEVTFDGLNLEDSSETFFRIPKVPLTSNTDIDFLAGDYVDAEMSGKAIKLSSEAGEIIFDDSVVYS